MNGNIVCSFAAIILEQRINTNCEVKLDEEKADAKLGDLQSKESSNDPEDKRDYQEEDIK